MKNIITSVILILCTFSLSIEVNAQTCPPDGWQGCNWTSHIQTYTLSSGCQVKVTYCTGCEGQDNPKLFISGIQPLNTLCDGVNFQTMLSQVQNALYHDPVIANQLEIPPCNPKGGGWVGSIVHMYIGQCWEMSVLFVLFGTPIPIFLPCQLAVCEEYCDVCVAPDGSVNVQNCQWSSIGSLSCSPVPSGSWEWNTCYTIAPCVQ